MLPKNLKGLISKAFFMMLTLGIANISQLKKRIAPIVECMKHVKKDRSPTRDRTIFLSNIDLSLIS